MEFRCEEKVGLYISGSAACELYNANHCRNLHFTRSNHSELSTIVKEWNLVCQDSSRVSYVQSVFMSGVLVGSLIFGVVSDSIGRRKTLCASGALIVLSSLLTGLAPSYGSLVIIRFIAGMSVAGNGIVGFVLGSELVGASTRSFFGIVVQLMFAVGICLMVPVAWLFPYWRHFTHALTAISLLGYSTYLILPESPCWLSSHGHLVQCRQVLMKIARANGVTIKTEDLVQLTETDDAEELKKQSGSGNGKEGITVIFQHWILLKWTVVQMFSWFVNSAVYYGLTMAAGGLSSSLLQSVFLSGLVELPAYVLVYMLIDRIGRKKSLCFSMLLGGVACMSIRFVGPGADLAHIRTGLALIGKMGIAASFSIIYIHSSEIFPTSMRNSGLGLCGMAARFGGITAPFITLMGKQRPYQEFVVFGVLSFSAGLFNLWLPETLHKPLPKSVSDLHRYHASAACDGTL